jgi:hypothetical protein
VKIYIVLSAPGINASQEVYTLEKAKEVQQAIKDTVITISIQDVLELLRILKSNPQKIANTIAKLEEYVETRQK